MCDGLGMAPAGVHGKLVSELAEAMVKNYTATQAKQDIDEGVARTAESLQSRHADQFLQTALNLLRERGEQYDQPSGERSMGKTVAAFNAITGRELTEAEGWLFMLLLKQVRQWQTPKYHQDSAEDAGSYSALLAEALERAK